MKIKFFIAAAFAACAFSSCSDMFDTESDRLVYNPDLNNKIDSIYYTYGALKGVQQAIDQYVLTNELRGDLATVTSDASAELKELNSFNVSATNRYDSAAVYYRIINNCNYYIAHRDTSLVTSGRKIAMSEYVEAFAIRAWAYLQLAKTYGKVPFYTQPLTDVNSVELVAASPKKNLQEICAALIPEMEKYSGTGVPNYGEVKAGTPENFTTEKSVASSKMMIPIDVILGDLYLETNNYAKAAHYYFTYLKNNRRTTGNYYSSWTRYPDFREVPTDLRGNSAHYLVGTAMSSWGSFFSGEAPSEFVTYVPMATNKLRGTTTELPALFGYNYYSTASGREYNSTPSIVGTDVYDKLSTEQTYYYGTGDGNNADSWTFHKASLGDMRRYQINEAHKYDDTESFNVMTKFNLGNIPLYRVAVIYLRLAEAVNRLNHPDVAFAILRDGINIQLLNNVTYMTEEGKNYLKTELPFLSDENIITFTNNMGIHAYGCGYTTGNSLYNFGEELKKKFDELSTTMGITIADTTLADTVNAVENLICDELALEASYEGLRYGDLCRLARHKNESNPYAAGTFGAQWLDNKLKFKTGKEGYLLDENNWYLPFN